VGLNIYIDTSRAVPLLILLSFLITFGLTRLYTRLARDRNWSSGHAGDVHLHHMVFGIVFILVAGFLALAVDPGHPWIDLLGVLFGVGAALTLDEFALWLHLKDVYWAEEGRASLDAIIMATMLGGLIVLGVTPFGIDKHASGLGIAIAVSVGTLFSLIALLKGKIFLGLAGLFIPIIAPIAAIRLARPSSPWARWRYQSNDKKTAKALSREKKRHARKLRVRDWIGGTPHLKSPQA
jgi:hypothetical protein